MAKVGIGIRGLRHTLLCRETESSIAPLVGAFILRGVHMLLRTLAAIITIILIPGIVPQAWRGTTASMGFRPIMAVAFTMGQVTVEGSWLADSKAVAFAAARCVVVDFKVADFMEAPAEDFTAGLAPEDFTVAP
jgi:hypothetical protein